MILRDSSSPASIESTQNLIHCSTPIVVYRFQQSRRSTFAAVVRQTVSRILLLPVITMFLNRCCYGGATGTTLLKRQIRRQYLPYSIVDDLNQHFFIPYNQHAISLSSLKPKIAFITTSHHQHNQQQQQSFFSTQAKQPRSANRWRSPILRPPLAPPPGSKRPPKLYSRLHNLRGKKKNNAEDSEGIIDDGKLYRADRVLANRTGKSRKECFQLLQDRRVFILKDEIYNEVSSTSSKKKGNIVNSPPLLNDTGTPIISNPDVINTIKENASENESNDREKSENKSIIQQYRLEVITGPAIKIGMHTKLRIDKYQDVPLPPPLLIIYHKPKWILSVRRDPMGRPCLDDVLLGTISTDSSKPNPSAVPPLHPVGRLDYDTTGLLLFSSSGPLTQALLHPKHSIEKEYVAVVAGIVDEDKLRDVLAAGVTTGEGVHTAQLVSAVPNTPPSEDVANFLAKIKSGLPTEYNTTDLKLRGYLDIFDATSLSTVTLTVSEGKYRMVRRMLANVGHPVVTLHRARLGEITLGDIPVGETRTLTVTELKWAQKQLKLGGKVLNPTEPKEKPPPPYDDDDEDLMP